MLDYDGGLTCSIGVANFDRALAFYRDVLGFELLYRREDIGWGELSTGIARVNVGLSEVETAGGAGGATLTFGVIDIDVAKAELDRHCVRQDGAIRDIPGLVRLLTFYDPDGNALMLYQDMRGA